MAESASQFTLFAIPKPWVGETAKLQENALASWAGLRDVQVVLFGDEKGVAEAAIRHGVFHVPEVERTEFGTPLIAECFASVEGLSRASLFCYVNADIILFEDLTAAVRKILLSKFLLAGRRFEFSVPPGEDLSNPARRRNLFARASEGAVPASIWHMDYFVFPRGIDWRFPPFAVGRAGWDGWLIRRAREMQIPIIDASRSILALHQPHGYEHVPGSSGKQWQGPESDRNLSLVSDPWLLGTLLDATHTLRDGRLERTRGIRYWRGRVLRFAAAHAWAYRLVRFLRPLNRFLPATRFGLPRQEDDPRVRGAAR